MHLLTTIKPTQNQLRVIAKIAATRDHPAQAASEISSDANLIAARNLLMKLDIITYTPNDAQLTKKGEQLARDQNIVDDSGGMTETGNKLAATEANGTPDDTMPVSSQEMPPAEIPPMEPIPPAMNIEGFSSLFKNMLVD